MPDRDANFLPGSRQSGRAIAGNLHRLVGFKLNQTELDLIGPETALKLFPKFKA